MSIARPRLPFIPLPDPASYYPRGPGWQGYESNPKAWVKNPRGTLTSGAVRKRADRYSAVLGQSQVHTPIWSNWMPGLGGFWEDTIGINPKNILDEAQGKADQLELALKLILGFSAVAAATGLYNAFRR